MAVYGSAHPNSPLHQTNVTSKRLISSCPHDWKAPWQVGLLILTSDSDNNVWWCVAAQTVGTAASCLQDVTKALVLVGSKDFYRGFLKGSGQVIAVENSTIHGNYRPGSPPLHDIALLRLESDAVFGLNVAPALIPKRHSPLLEINTEMVISGWGTTEKSRAMQEQLRCARVPVVLHSVCRRAYKRLGLTIRRSHVCAGYSSGYAGPCSGDAGGGLVHRGSDGNNTVFGIISWSLGCGRHCGVYTNVQMHKPWLFQKAPELARKALTGLAGDQEPGTSQPN